MRVGVVQVVVLPSSAVVPQAGLLGVWPLAALFAAVTLVTTLGANGVPFLAAFITGDASGINGESLAGALPGTVATFAILGARPCSRRCVTILPSIAPHSSASDMHLR